MQDMHSLNFAAAAYGERARQVVMGINGFDFIKPKTRPLVAPRRF